MSPNILLLFFYFSPFELNPNNCLTWRFFTKHTQNRLFLVIHLLYCVLIARRKFSKMGKKFSFELCVIIKRWHKHNNLTLSLFQVLPVCDLQPLAHGENLRCPHLLLPSLCRLHGLMISCSPGGEKENPGKSCQLENLNICDNDSHDWYLLHSPYWQCCGSGIRDWVPF